MSTHEIITLQFGNYSNFVGTHYWNFHHKRLLEFENSTEDNRSYVTKLFRESQSSRSCFVPRAIVFDIKSKLSSLKQDGSFGDTNEIAKEVLNNNSNAVIFDEPVIEKNQFVKQIQSGEVDPDANFECNFESEVKTWTDFMSYEFDSHTVQLLSETYKDGEDFSFFGIGQDEYKQLEDDFEDNLHFWAEECDYLEGFQFMTDLHNGYTGLQSKVSEYLADEYKKKAKLNFMNWYHSSEEDNTSKDIFKYLNIALTLQNMKEYVSLMVIQATQSEFFGANRFSPVRIPGIDYQADLPYHTSGILAAALDSSTIPLYQTNNSRMSLSELCQHVSYGKWKLAGSSFGLPMVQSEHETLFDAFTNSKDFYNAGSFATPLFPSLGRVQFHPTTQLVVLQNLPFDQVCPSNIDSKVLQNLGLNYNVFHQTNPFSVLEYFNERLYPCEQTVSKTYYSRDRLRNELPFPNIIVDDDRNSLTKQPKHRKSDSGVTSFSTLYTSPCFYDFLHDTIMVVKNANWHKLHAVQDHGLDNDSLTELVEDLVYIAQSYNYERAFNDMEVDG